MGGCKTMRGSSDHCCQLFPIYALSC